MSEHDDASRNLLEQVQSGSDNSTDELIERHRTSFRSRRPWRLNNAIEMRRQPVASSSAFFQSRIDDFPDPERERPHRRD
jgi:hypothetical protein